MKLRLISATALCVGLLAVAFLLGRGSIAPRLQQVTYDCSAPRDVKLKPFIDKYPDGLEFFMAGWIYEGRLTINGVPEDKTIILEDPGQQLHEQYMGEWYSPDGVVQLRPDLKSSCYIRIVYRVRSTIAGMLGG